MKHVKLPDGEMSTFCYDEQKLISLLIRKHLLIKNHLERIHIAKHSTESKKKQAVKKEESGGIIHKVKKEVKLE